MGACSSSGEARPEDALLPLRPSHCRLPTAARTIPIQPHSSETCESDAWIPSCDPKALTVRGGTPETVEGVVRRQAPETEGICLAPTHHELQAEAATGQRFVALMNHLPTDVSPEAAAGQRHSLAFLSMPAQASACVGGLHTWMHGAVCAAAPLPGPATAALDAEDCLLVLLQHCLSAFLLHVPAAAASQYAGFRHSPSRAPGSSSDEWDFCISCAGQEGLRGIVAGVSGRLRPVPGSVGEGTGQCLLWQLNWVTSFVGGGSRDRFGYFSHWLAVEVPRLTCRAGQPPLRYAEAQERQLPPPPSPWPKPAPRPAEQHTAVETP